MDRKSVKERNAVGMLEQLMGEGEGDLYQLAQEVISLGRNNDNSIVLASESVSRYHAEIQVKENGEYIIEDLESKNGVVINGEAIKKAILETGDVVQIGEFAFRFSGPSILKGAEEGHLMHRMEPGGMMAEERPRSKKKQGINKRFILYGTLALVVGLVLMMGNDTGKSDESDVATNGGAKKTWSDAARLKEPLPPGKIRKPSVSVLEDPTLTKAEQALSKINWSDKSVQESERYFRSGQKEYFNKNYHRAIKNFDSSLSFNKKHPLAGYYRDRSLVASEREATTHMDIGVRYFQSLQYRRAIYHFSQTINMMDHRPTVMEAKLASKLIEAAKKYIGICKKQLQAAELYP